MGHILDWSHETVLAAEPVSASRARDFVCTHLAEHHLLYLVEDVRLVVSEFATNAVSHAAAHTHTSFVVTLEEVGPNVLLTVREGSPSAPLEPVREDTARGGSTGGFMADVLCRDWGVATGHGTGESVWAAFPTRPKRSIV